MTKHRPISDINALFALFTDVKVPWNLGKRASSLTLIRLAHAIDEGVRIGTALSSVGPIREPLVVARLGSRPHRLSLRPLLRSESLMTPVKWGIMGTGGIAQVFAAALERSELATLTGVASRDGERAAAFAAQHPGARGFRSYEEMLAAPDIEVIYVATPQHRHAEDALAVLASGKHALIEKPLVMDSASALTIKAEADQRGLIALEAMWTLFNPLVARLLDVVSSGRLGALRSFAANTGPIGVPLGHRALNADLGASLMWECLVYPVALLTAIAPTFARPDHANAVSLMRDRSFDDASAVLLTSGSAFAQFSGAFSPGSAEAASSRVQLAFEHGWVELSELYNPSNLRIGWTDGRVDDHHEEADQVGFGYEIDAVSRAVRGAASIPAYLQLSHTIDNVLLIERLREDAIQLHAG